MRKIFIITIALLFIYNSNLYGQIKNPFYLGIQPSVTIEPFYEEGELDINVFPLVFETPVNQRVNLRIVPIVNYHIGGTDNGVSDLGVFTVLPVFFKKNEDEKIKPYGFYIGPVLGFGRNLINDHYTTTIAMEPGYMFETKRSFTITLGIQIGASYFGYDSEPNKWILHWGPKVTFGFWIG